MTLTRSLRIGTMGGFTLKRQASTRWLAHAASSKTPSSNNPLHPDVKVDDLGLPVDPQTSPSTARYYNPAPVALTREQLHKLHKLSALKPPQEGSPEEEKLLQDLGGLIGLMDVVKEVSLPRDPKELAELLKGFGQSEQVFDGTNMTREKPTSMTGLKGRELLKYASSSERGLYIFKSK